MRRVRTSSALKVTTCILYCSDTAFGVYCMSDLYHGKPSLQRHRLRDIQLSKGIPWQLYQLVDIMISTWLI